MSELNHHNDPGGLMRSLHERSSGKVHLGNMGAIDDLVRKFVFDIIDRFDKVGAGVLTPNSAAEADKAECVRLGKVFAGQDDNYTPLADWNGKRLADHIRWVMGGTIQADDPDEGVIAQLFAVLVHSVYSEIKILKDSTGDALNQLISSTVLTLIGLRPHE